MRRLMFVLVAMLTAVTAAAAPASAEPATVVTQPFVITLENPCNGEVVLVEGTMHGLARFGVDEGGGEHLFNFFAIRGTGIGLTTGAEYRVKYLEGDPNEANSGPERALSGTNVFNIHIVGTEPGNSFYTHVNHHTTISPTGHGVLFQLNDQSECR